MRPLPLAAALACCAAAVLPATAAADTLTYVKDGNLLVANPDGSGARQITSDGGYSSPAAADDGTIVAAKGDRIVRLTQAGTVLGSFVPPVLQDSVGGTAGGQPSQIDVSPDGTKIAYMRASLNCDPTVECRARATSGVVDTAGNRLPDPGLYGEHPSFLDDGRLIYHAGYLSENLVWTLGASTVAENWFGDADTDLTDGRLSADRRRWVQTRGYGDERSIITYDASAGQLPSTPPKPLCETSTAPGVGDPTIDATGQTFWWTESGGVWVKTAGDNCTDPQPRLLIPGAKEADWGPAPLAPVTPPGPPAPQPQPQPQPKPGGSSSTPKAKAKVAKVKRGTRTVSFRVTCPSRCSFTATLVKGKRTVAKTKGTAKAGRAKAVQLRHRGKRGLKLRVKAGGRTITVAVPR